jgi:Leucine rich repeat
MQQPNDPNNTMMMETIGLDTLSPIKNDSRLGRDDNDDEYQHNAITSLRNDSNTPWYRTKYVRYGSVLALLVLVIAAIAVPVSYSKKAATSTTSSLEPVIVEPQVSTQQYESNKDAFSETVMDYYKTYKLDWTVVRDDQSPQALALQWVAGSSQFSTLDRSRNVQRYVLAVLYYSTYNVQHQYWNEAKGHTPTGWTSSLNWMSSEAESEWEGVTCEGDAVVGILLREHKMSGTLPLELAFLSTSLVTLDVTSNYIYLNGDASVTPLTYLASVDTLLLEDNYVLATKGMPNGMSAMTSLVKVSLSYNLLQGHLDESAFTQLTKLTHLEVESNYLRGSLPTDLLYLPDLVYLDLDLPTVLGNATLPSLFAIWMDSNNVTGPIPSTIADKASLASLSITNTTLQSSIPTEIGNLTGMRRLWLYDNDLSGDIPSELGSLPLLEVFEVHGNARLKGAMPQGVCDTIDQAKYEFKSLTATCATVDCKCCTACK